MSPVRERCGERYPPPILVKSLLFHDDPADNRPRCRLHLPGNCSSSPEREGGRFGGRIWRDGFADSFWSSRCRYCAFEGNDDCGRPLHDDFAVTCNSCNSQCRRQYFCVAADHEWSEEGWGDAWITDSGN